MSTTKQLPEPYYDDGKGIVIYHGECREILPSIPPGSVDLVLTDPPYGVSVAGASIVKPPGEGVTNLDFFPGDDDWATTRETVLTSLRMAVDVCHVRASLYAFVGHRSFGGVVSELEGRGWSTRFVIWAKPSPAPRPPGAGWPSGAELCVYGYQAGRTWNGDALRTNVLTYDSYRHGQPGRNGHPTQKPLAMITILIRISANPGHLVLDPFMGSGTTLVAARSLGCRAIGIEVEERYCEMAARRLAQGVLEFAT